MRKTLFMVLSMALVVSSCKKDKAAEVSTADNWYYLDASINEEQQESKTTIDDGNFGKEIVWDENDKIAVYTAGSDKYVFVQDGEAGGTETRFKYNGTPDFKGEEVYTAIYPESMVSGNAGELVTSWPSEQTVKYGHPMTVAIPMLASGTIVDDTLEGAQFDCLGGILNLVLKIPETGNEGENTGGYLRKIEISADQVLSGDFHFVTDEGQTKMVFEQTASNRITLTFEGAQGEENEGVFLLPGQEYQTNIMLPQAPDGGYTNLKMVFYDETGTLLYTMQSKKPLNIQKATVTPVRLTFAYLHRPALTYSDPAGTVGVLNGRKAIVVDANGCKFALAMENVGATEINPLGTPFSIHAKRTQEDLDQLGLTDGWRLPTAYEWSQLIRINPAGPFGKPYKMYVGDDKFIFLPTERIEEDPDRFRAYYALLNDKFCARISLKSDYYPNGSEMNIALCSNDPDNSNVFVRPVHTLPRFPDKDTQPHILTKDDPVGTEGYVSDDDYTEAVMMELCGRKVAVAKKNVGAESEFDMGKNLNGDFHMKYTDTTWPTLNLENGWDLPSKDELSDMLGVTMKDYYPIDTPVLFNEHDDCHFGVIYMGDTRLVLPAIDQKDSYFYRAVYLITSEYPVHAKALFADYDHGLVHENLFESFIYDGVLPIYARAVYEFENITASSPVGTRGKYNGLECVVAMLGGKKMLVSVNCAYYSHLGLDRYETLCFLDNKKMNEYPKEKSSWGEGWRIINEEELAIMLQGITNDVTEGISNSTGRDSRFYWMVGDYKLTFNLWGRCQEISRDVDEIIVDEDKLFIMSSTIVQDKDDGNGPVISSKGIELKKDIDLNDSSDQVRELSTLFMSPHGEYRYQTYLVHEMPTE